MLYHYTTWNGFKIFEEKVLKVSSRYAAYTYYAGYYPPLVFLSEDKIWEPTVQAATKEFYWESCGSCPDTYQQLEIPCWRFTVDSDIEVEPAIKVCSDLGLSAMIEHGIKLGADPTKWWVSRKSLAVTQAAQWEGVWSIK